VLLSTKERVLALSRNILFFDHRYPFVDIRIYPILYHRYPFKISINILKYPHKISSFWGQKKHKVGKNKIKKISSERKKKKRKEKEKKKILDGNRTRVTENTA
jgi:hypothetical protein